MEKETYNKLLGERLNEIQEISKKVDFKNLTYYFKTSSISPIHFIKFKGPFVFFKETRDSDKLLKEAEEEQIKFKSELSEITREKPKDKLKNQSYTIKNVKNLYNLTQKLDLKPLMKQNKMKQNREQQDLK